MATLKTFGLLCITLSIIGGGIAYWIVSINTENADNIIFKIVAVSSLVLAFCGLMFMILSKKKPDPFKEGWNALLKKEKSEGNCVVEKAIEPQKPRPQSGGAPLSIEEELRQSKRKYFSEATTMPPIEKGPEPKKAPTASNSAPAPSKPEKVKISIGLPFGKKKDKYHEMLEEEEKSLEGEPEWKSK